ncbi:MAG: helix-turn-helix transcriptional regulator [Oscillospiraceae bacterium]|nr:helix-turn-helix transcriptional regulator [Oscillospiraceae bacterium]
MTFGQKLQNLRKEKGMSQEKLADRLSVSRQAVSRWELDISLPETENIIKIKNIFDVSFDYLLDENIDNPIISGSKIPRENSGKNEYIEAFISFVKKYGYIAGYLLSAVSLYCLTGYTITFLSIKKTFSDMFASGVPNTMTYILLMYMRLSLAGTAGGFILAKHIKKKTEKYRNTAEMIINSENGGDTQ